MKRYKEFWRLVDFIESAIHIDLYHILKYLGIRKFNDIFDNDLFASLPLHRSKDIISVDRIMKGKEIYFLWKENREMLEEYIVGML